MIVLSEIRDYVQKTALIIASVLEMQVIISDLDNRLLGDSEQIKVSELDCLSERSILRKVMISGESIVLEDLDQHEGCRTCKKREKCDVLAIVGVPIKYQGKVIGSIGILADSKSAKEKLLEKRVYYSEFIDQMSDLLLSKLKEREKNKQLMVLRQRLISIIDTIDGGLVAIDELGEIIYINTKAYELFGIKAMSYDNRSISDFLVLRDLDELIENGTNFKNRELRIDNQKKSVHTLVSGRRILVGNKNCGAIITIKKLKDVYEEVNDLYNGHIETGFDELIGDSNSMKTLKRKALRVSKGLSTISICGESGTGKELIARAIHGASSVAKGPFVAVNCAAIPDSLLESELFGYEEGAFSGAKKGGKLGKFQLADGGTLFLDEIGEMPLHLQTKLLRVIQERKIDKIGASKSIPINVRIIAATNKDLEKMIVTGEFREDLFYRLYVIPIVVPPLRERLEDLDQLIKYFLNRYNEILSKNIKGVSQDVMTLFMEYDWPGNVRELQNVLEYAANMTTQDYIGIGHIPSRLYDNADRIQIEEEKMIRPLEETVLSQIKIAVDYYGNSVEGKTKAAQALGISRATLYRKLSEN
jgi:transcriptional regulator with PAS, ATPase and Fis domain